MVWKNLCSPGKAVYHLEKQISSGFLPFPHTVVLFNRPGWLEPLLDRIGRDPTTVVCPVIDVISDDSLEYHHRDASGVNVGGFDWNLQVWHLTLTFVLQLSFAIARDKSLYIVKNVLPDHYSLLNRSFGWSFWIVCLRKIVDNVSFLRWYSWLHSPVHHFLFSSPWIEMIICSDDSGHKSNFVV